MIKSVLWIGMSVVFVPAVASGGKDRSPSQSGILSGMAWRSSQELERDLSSYRHEGSLWKDRKADFYMDNKARHINDIVTIQIVENSNASQQVSTKTSRETNILAKITKFLGSPLSFGLDNFWGKDTPFRLKLKVRQRVRTTAQGQFPEAER